MTGRRYTLATIPTAVIRDQRHLTVLDDTSQALIQGRVTGTVPIGDRVQVSLNLVLSGSDRWPVVLGPLPGDTACVVGTAS